MSNWDVAAAGLIAERAGATVTDDGRRAAGSTSARKPRAVGVGRRAGGAPRRTLLAPDALGARRG